MSVNFNEVRLIGNLTQNSELSTTGDNTAMCKFSVAFNNYRKKNDGYIEESNYIDLAIFGDKAVKLSALLVKGKRVLILGALKQERWETDENEKRSKITIRVAGVILLNDRNGYKENEN